MIPQADYETIIMDAIPGIKPERAQDILAQLGLSQDISDYLHELAAKMEAGEPVPKTWDEVWQHLNRMAREKYGCEYGIPLPSTTDVNRPMITARGTPLRVILQANMYSDNRLALPHG